MLDRELKKGSAELIILSIVETRAAPRLRDQPADRAALGRAAEVPHRLALSRCSTASKSAAGCRGGGSRKPGQRRRRFYRLTAEGPPRAGQPAQYLEDVRGRDAADHRSRPCLIAQRLTAGAAPGRIPAPAAGAARAAADARARDRRRAVAASRRSLRGAARRAASADVEARRLALEELREPRHARRDTCGRCGRRDRRRRSRRARQSRGAVARPPGRISATPPACCAASPASRPPPS